MIVYEWVRTLILRRGSIGTLDISSVAIHHYKRLWSCSHCLVHMLRVLVVNVKEWQLSTEHHCYMISCDRLVQLHLRLVHSPVRDLRDSGLR